MGVKSNVRLDLTVLQHTPLGSVLHNVLYNTQNKERDFFGLFSYGCPHSGSEHILILRGYHIDLIAYIDILQERYGDRFGITSEFKIIRDCLENGNKDVFSAKMILRQHFSDVY